MNVTNKYSLPEVFERFDRANKHSAEGADISVTHLIDSPRIRHLKAAHDDQLSVDVSDMALSILGTAVHKILEEGATLIPGVIAERRYHASIDGMSISGQIDLVTPATTDTCSAITRRCEPSACRLSQWVNCPGNCS